MSVYVRARGRKWIYRLGESDVAPDDAWFARMSGIDPETVASVAVGTYDGCRCWMVTLRKW